MFLTCSLYKKQDLSGAYFSSHQMMSVSIKPLLLVKLLLSLSFTKLVSSWGQFPHRAIALLSARFLLPETAQYISSILPKSESIPSAAIWPDYFSHTPEGRWSGPLHYIDGHWNEQGKIHKCGLDYDRDCSGNTHCVIWGIVNSTQQLLLPYISPSQAQIDEYEESQRITILPFVETDLFQIADKDTHIDASAEGNDGSGVNHQILTTTSNPPTWLSPHHLHLRFLLHFISDLHQPLHTIGYKRGGNEIPILFHGKPGNLHSAWDTLIPIYGYLGNKVGRVSPRDSVTWADALFNKIEHLRQTLEEQEWQRKFVGKCFQQLDSDLDDSSGRDTNTPRQELLNEEMIQDCMLEWADQANAFVCSFAFHGTDGADTFIDQELTGKDGKFYAEEAFKIAEELVMLAGWRLAGWLNLVATGRTGLSGQVNEVTEQGRITNQAVLDAQQEL